MEPRSHDSLSSIRPRGWDDGVTFIHWWGRSVGISMKR